MKKFLELILNIQDLDMKMIRLMRIKKERLKEIEEVLSLRKELELQLKDKEQENENLKNEVSSLEIKIAEIGEKFKKLEAQQGVVKKVKEFNIITQQMTLLEKEKREAEQKIADLSDKKIAEEALLVKIREGLKASNLSSSSLENEIHQSISLINAEGRSLKQERDRLASAVPPEDLQMYERLLRNKRDRVVVPIENRVCGGCHITLNAQHESIVRREEGVVFCEYCSRIHYWQPEAVSAEGAVFKRKKRKTAAS